MSSFATMIFAQALAAVPVVPMESQAQVTSAVDTAKKVLDTKADSASPKKAGCFSCFSGTSPSPCYRAAAPSLQMLKKILSYPRSTSRLSLCSSLTHVAAHNTGKTENQAQTQIVSGAPQMALLVASTDEAAVTQAQLQSNLNEMPTAAAAAAATQPAADEAPTKT
jgi:hypothetical protein